jgi:hypothetical protein
MTKLITTLLVAITITTANADTLIYKAESIELEMKKGAFSSDSRSAEQLLTITNHSVIPIRSSWIECGFTNGLRHPAKSKRVHQDERLRHLGGSNRLPLQWRVWGKMK